VTFGEAGSFAHSKIAIAGGTRPAQAVSQKFPPTWHVRSTSSLPSPSGNGLSITLKSADDAKDDNKRV